MKKSWLIVLFCGLFVQLNAQLVITEISYNPPESGTDSLEYIELFNAGNQAINLEGYSFVNGVDYTFPAITLNAEEFIVVAIDSAAMLRVFGAEARQWKSGALNNSGERIAIEDGNGSLVDEVEYDDEGDWPGFSDGTDGGGASIELCDVESNNFDGTNWRAASNDLGVEINGVSLKGTPGFTNTVRCLPPHDFYVSISNNVFTPRDITINVGNTVIWENLEGTHNVNGTSSTFPANPSSFSSGPLASGNWTYTHTFDVPGEYDYRCDAHFGIGMTGTVTVLDIDPYPAVEISALRTVNSDGIPDSIGKAYTIEGVVHGPNFFTGGIQVTIIDGNRDGIEIFNPGADLGYQPELGDLVRVKGTVNQYFGMTQFDVAEIELLSTNNALFSPRPVIDLNESTESDLIMLEGLTLVDPSEWGMGGSSGFNALTTNGVDTFLIRVDAESELFGPENPGNQVFNLVGLGGQYDFSSPYFSGYQIWPRYREDLQIVTSSVNKLVGNVRVFPNPVRDRLGIATDGHTIERIILYDLCGSKLLDRPFTSELMIDGLSGGMYLMKLISSSDGQLTVPIVIQP